MVRRLEPCLMLGHVNFLQTQLPGVEARTELLVAALLEPATRARSWGVGRASVVVKVVHVVILPREPQHVCVVVRAPINNVGVQRLARPCLGLQIL